MQLLILTSGYQALRLALTDLGHSLSPGTMVIIESTIAPRAMAKVVKPIVEETSGLRVNEDFYLVNGYSSKVRGRGGNLR